MTNLNRTKNRLVSRLYKEELWGFDTLREVFQAILTHDDYAYRWDVELNTKFLVDAYRRQYFAAAKGGAA